MRRILPILCILAAALLIPASAFSQGGRNNSVGEQASSSYVIQPLDFVSFRIIGEDADVQMRVSSDGTVVLPFIRAVTIVGMTVAEAQKHIFDLYNGDYFIDPQLDLTIYASTAMAVEVMGLVMRQGTVPIPPEENLYLLEAISMAGGAQSLGNMRDVKIRRADENGQQTEISVDTTTITTRDFPLQDGDVIFIPRRRI